MLELVIYVIVDLQRDFICIVVQIDEAVVQEESAVALLAVAIIDLLSSLDIFDCFDDESLSLVCVGPRSLSRSLVVQHVCVGHETICFDAFDLNAEDSGGDHHSDLGVLFQGELNVFGHFFTDKVVVSLNVFDLFFYLVQECTTLQ